MQFDRPHHQRIAHVLNALNGATLLEHGCYFGGGTCIALCHGKYRESVGIDFLVSDAVGYRELRQQLTNPAGLAAITHPHTPPLVALREIRADQYGIRTQIQMDGHSIKAIDRLQHRAGWLERCMQVMSMQMPKAVLWQKVRSLRRIVPPAL